MSDHGIAMSTAGACVLVGTRTTGAVTCPHCGEAIVLKDEGHHDGCLSVECPHCSGESLLVRVVSVLHRAIRLPRELLELLRRELETSVVEPSAVQTPPGVFTLSVSRGAIVLLAMMWQQAERSGSTTIESSVTLLARRLLTGRGMVRRWLAELVEAGVLRELSTPEQRPRVWELLPVPSPSKGEEVDRG